MTTMRSTRAPKLAPTLSLKICMLVWSGSGSKEAIRWLSLTLTVIRFTLRTWHSSHPRQASNVRNIFAYISLSKRIPNSPVRSALWKQKLFIIEILNQHPQITNLVVSLSSPNCFQFIMDPMLIRKSNSPTSLAPRTRGSQEIRTWP